MGSWSYMCLAEVVHCQGKTRMGSDWSRRRVATAVKTLPGVSSTSTHKQAVKVAMDTTAPDNSNRMVITLPIIHVMLEIHLHSSARQDASFAAK